MKRELVLGLETGIFGGSVSIGLDSEELDFRVGEKDISRSEDLLWVLDDLLARNNFKKSEINLVAVSVGVGSFTGIRIGLATALGIQKAVGCRIVQVPLLEALAQKPKKIERVLCAVSINQREVGWQIFSGAEKTLSPQVAPFKEFTDGFRDFLKEVNRTVLSKNIFEFLLENKMFKFPEDQVSDAGLNLARYIGSCATINASDNEKT